MVAEWAQVQPGREIPAYALGERAFTPSLSGGVVYAPLGRWLPLWVTLALPLGLVVGGWLLVRAARALAPASPPPPTIGPSPWS